MRPEQKPEGSIARRDKIIRVDFGFPVNTQNNDTVDSLKSVDGSRYGLRLVLGDPDSPYVEISSTIRPEILKVYRWNAILWGQE